MSFTTLVLWIPRIMTLGVLGRHSLTWDSEDQIKFEQNDHLLI